MKRRIYEEIDGVFYSSVEQAVSELNIPKYLVMKSLKSDLVVKFNGIKYLFSWLD